MAGVLWCWRDDPAEPLSAFSEHSDICNMGNHCLAVSLSCGFGEISSGHQQSRTEPDTAGLFHQSACLPSLSSMNRILFSIAYI